LRNIPVFAVLLALGASLPAPNARSSGCSSGVQFYPDSSDCNAYYQCANGNPVQLHCGTGLHWNNKAFTCDRPANAGCVLGKGGNSGGDDDDSGDSSKSSGDDSTSEESVPGSDSSSSESNECPEDSKPPKCPSVDPALSVFFPHSGDAHWFYHCSNGVAYCKVCPSPLVWNSKCDTCDWEGQDNCPKESSESGDSSKSSGDDSTSEESVPGSDSSSSESEPAPPPPKPTEKQSSESGDSSKSSGDDSTSEESVPGSDSSSSESNECPEDSKPPKCPSVDPALSVFFPHSGDAHWFYHCSNGVAYCKVCPSPLVWNSKCDTCDWEGQDNCPKSSESGDSSKSSGDDSTIFRNTPAFLSILAVLLALGASLPAPNARSSGCSSGVQYFPDSTDCNAYYQCANGNPVQLRCGAGLHWNNKAFACDWPANAGCVLGKGENSGGDDDDSGDSSKSSGDDSTSEESVPGSDSSSSESNECPEDSKPPKCPSVDPALSVFFPHSGDAHWFYHCSNGVAYCKVCPAPLVWNSKCDTCDWEGQDNCPKESSESGDSSKSSGDDSTSEESVPGSDSSSSESEPALPPPKPTEKQSSESGDSSKSSGDDSTSEESVPGSDSSSSESNECPADSKPPKCPSVDPALSVFFPHSGDSHWFYHCSNGVAYCKVCPSPLVWNSKCDTCDWEGQDNCPKESSESGDSSKSSGDDSTSEESVPGSDSSSSESEPAPPPPKPTEKQSSESGDSSKSSGDDSTSEESVPGSDSSSSESNECPEDSKPPKCPSVDPALSVFFPHSKDPHYYYQCSNGVAYCQPCPAPLVWNPKCDTCDWEGQNNCPKESSESGDSSKSSGDDSTSEESVPGSDSSSSESEPAPPPPKPTEKQSSESGDSSKSSGDDSTSEESVPGSDSSSSESNECPEDSKPPKCPSVDPALSVFFPHSGDAHWFYHCSNGVAYCKVCPSPLVWNSKCDTCDWEGQDNCPKSNSSKSSGDDSTSEESVPGSDSSSSESEPEPEPTPEPTEEPSSESGDSSKSSGDDSTSEESVPGSDSSSSESNECPEDSKPPKCPSIDPALSVFFPHSGDAHWFYHCSNGVAYCKNVNIVHQNYRRTFCQVLTLLIKLFEKDKNRNNDKKRASERSNVCTSKCHYYVRSGKGDTTFKGNSTPMHCGLSVKSNNNCYYTFILISFVEVR
ncbi:hypothetical protein C0J52_18874, partial [Blattella germanica]